MISVRRFGKALPITGLALMLAGLAQGVVQASNWGQVDIYPGSGVDYARVVSVQPRIVQQQTAIPVQDCNETPGYRVIQQRDHRSSTAPTVIAGGVIGGLVGNNVGSGSGRDAARVVGTLAGAAIAHDIARSRQPAASQTWVPGQTHCQTRTTYRSDERVDGYIVTYEYRGRHYTTQMSEYPGSMIPIAVHAAPMRR